MHGVLFSVVHFLAVRVNPLGLSLPFPSARLSLLIVQVYPIVRIVQDMRPVAALGHQIEFINPSSLIHL